MPPFIFLKAEGGPLKEADWAKKKKKERERERENASKEQWSTIWNCVTALGAAERQKCTQAYGELPVWTTTPPVTPLESYKQRCIH